MLLARMNSGAKDDIHISCFFFDKKNDKVVYRYKIVERAADDEFPFQLFRYSEIVPSEWKNLSTYPSVRDAVSVVLKELLSEELADEVYHGQAILDPQIIVNKVNQGERSISIFDAVDNELFGTGYYVIFDELIKRGRNRPRRMNWFKKDDG